MAFAYLVCVGGCGLLEPLPRRRGEEEIGRFVWCRRVFVRRVGQGYTPSQAWSADGV
jgi:hypothetical protein